MPRALSLQSITLSLRSVATTGVQLIIVRRILSLRSNSYNWRTAVQFLNTFSVKVNDHNVTLNSMHFDRESFSSVSRSLAMNCLYFR